MICGSMFTQLPVGFTDAWKRVQPCPEQIIFPVLITTTTYKEDGVCVIILPVLATTTANYKEDGVVICGSMFTQLPVGFTDARKRVQPCPEQIIFPVLITTTAYKKGRELCYYLTRPS